MKFKFGFTNKVFLEYKQSLSIYTLPISVSLLQWQELYGPTLNVYYLALHRKKCQSLLYNMPLDPLVLLKQVHC